MKTEQSEITSVKLKLCRCYSTESLSLAKIVNYSWLVVPVRQRCPAGQNASNDAELRGGAELQPQPAH